MNNPKATVDIKKLILDLMNLASKQYFSKWLTLVSVLSGQDHLSDSSALLALSRRVVKHYSQLDHSVPVII